MLVSERVLGKKKGKQRTIFVFMQDGPFLGCVGSAVCVFGVCVSVCVSVCGAYDCAVISQEEEPVRVQTAYLLLACGSTRSLTQ